MTPQTPRPKLREKEKARLLAARAKKTAAANDIATSLPGASVTAASSAPSMLKRSKPYFPRTEKRRTSTVAKMSQRDEKTEEKAPMKEVKKAEVYHQTNEKRKRDHLVEDEGRVEIKKARVDHQNNEKRKREHFVDDEDEIEVKKAKVHHQTTVKRKRVRFVDDEDEDKVEKNNEPVREFKKIRLAATKAKVAAEIEDEGTPAVVSARPAGYSATYGRVVDKGKAHATSYDEWERNRFFPIEEYIPMPALEADDIKDATALGDERPATTTVIGMALAIINWLWELYAPSEVASGGRNQQEQEEKVREKEVKQERKAEQDNKEENVRQKEVKKERKGEQDKKEEKVREKEVKKERKGEQDKKEEYKVRGIIASSSSSSFTHILKTTTTSTTKTTPTSKTYRPSESERRLQHQLQHQLDHLRQPQTFRAQQNQRRLAMMTPHSYEEYCFNVDKSRQERAYSDWKKQQSSREASARRRGRICT